MHISIFDSHLNCRLQNLMLWTLAKILLFGKVLTLPNNTMSWQLCQSKFFTNYHMERRTLKKTFSPPLTLFSTLLKLFRFLLYTFVFCKCFQSNRLPHLSPNFNPFPNKPWFSRVCSASLIKTLWEKKKLLITSNFSFSQSVFYWFGELSAIFLKFKSVVC